ncbi:hypothetical protein BDM02DRAFT_508389 [Thelephora ganbajun]|uniref:Uncharacterized protein n=1 Tax=Thelephora ganbajun TaxID=370292 RepID=A0ACB6Z709_THEGA|nr:hypothetical protein BDM02DRAFT_508389 [Thelephora ganbajun]
MSYNARTLVLTTLVVICASPVLASRRHLRYYSSNPHPYFVGDSKNYHTKIKATSPEYGASQWPSNTDDCLSSEVHLRPNAPALYLRDGQVYDKRCLKTLAYLVEPEERAVCRTQNDCHYTRGYDNDCLIQLPFDQGFNFDLEEARRQELEWKKFVCHGKTLDQCGRDHSSWWRSRFPSSRDDCRIRGRADKRTQDDNWVPWSIGPYGTLYDNDCLSRFANRLGMENPRNCTQTNTYVAREARDAPPVELPKTLVYATDPSGIQPHLAFPTAVTNPSRLTATPIPTPEDSISDIISEPFTTNIPDFRKSDAPPPPARTLTETANAVPTSLPLTTRDQGSATDVDEWPCMWDVDVTLPDSAPGMFDAAFGNVTVDETQVVTQKIFTGDLRECGDAIERG